MNDEPVVKREPKVVKCVPATRVSYPHATHVYITMMADLVHVLAVSDSVLPDASAESLADEVLNAAYILRTGAEV